MRAEKMVQDKVLKPWQVYLSRLLRSTSFTLVEVDYAKEIGRLEAKLLWANRHGMEFPPYFLKALRESVEFYQGQGTFERPDPHAFVF